MADCKTILGLWSTLFSIHVDGSVDVDSTAGTCRWVVLGFMGVGRRPTAFIEFNTVTVVVRLESSVFILDNCVTCLYPGNPD